MAGTMNNRELEIANFQLLIVFEIFINFGRLLKVKAELFPLVARNADPGCLLRQPVVDPLVRLMKHDASRRLQPLEIGYATDMIEMRMRANNRFQIKIMTVDGFNDHVGVVTGIDADCAAGVFTADDACVLLKSSDGQFFDNHLRLRY